MLSRRSLAAFALVPVIPAVGAAAVPPDPIMAACYRTGPAWRTFPDDDGTALCPTELDETVPRTVAGMRMLIDRQIALWGEPDPDDPWGIVVMQLRVGLQRMKDRA